jgi:L-erythro-3,5-diaminohexanoate dehydrogenase
MPERLSLAVLDVAGAAPQVARLVKPGMRVLVLGAGGKSGILCAYEAKRRGATVVGVESYAPFAQDLNSLGYCDAVIEGDARDPLAVRAKALAATGGHEFDLTLSCVNVDHAEMTAIVCTKDRGIAYFFAMSTSFTRAALGAEGVGKDIDLLIGNGYAHDHANHSLSIIREDKALRALFERRYT